MADEIALKNLATGGGNTPSNAVKRQNDKRLSNIDLLRTICSVFVIFEHFCEQSAHNAFGITADSSMVAYIMLRLIYGVARFAVPCFFIISGYLSIESNKQKYGKALGLFSMVILYSLIPIVFQCCIQIVKSSLSADYLTEIVRYAFPKNYYLYLFVAIYMLSPFINKAVVRLTKKQYARLLIICFVLFSLWSTLINTFIGATNNDDIVGVFFTSRTGTSMGFNVANFMTLYLAGGYLKLHFTPSKEFSIIAVLIVLISAVSTTVTKICLIKYAKAVLYYDSVFVVLGAVSFFILFIKQRNSDRSSILSVTGKNTFGVYLIHGFASSCIEIFISIEKTVSKGFAGTILGIVIFVFGTYLLSLLMSLIIFFVFNPMNKRIKRMTFLNEKIFCE